MTIGVPYSFVPGTKAKADEVNANFNDVISKIENTNLRIDETNSNASVKNKEIETKFEDIQSLIDNRADLDLSNLSTTGSAVLSAKANNSDLDSQWVAKSVVLAEGVTFSNTAETSYSLASYLPNDGGLYQVKFFVAGNASNTAQWNYTMGFNWEQVIFVKANNFNSNMIGLADSTRKLRIVPTTLCSGTTKASVTLRAYRKVR